MVIQDDMTPTTLTVDSIAAGQRLDIFIAARFPDHSRSALQRAIKSGAISVNGKPSKPRYLVKEGDVISIEVDWSPAPSAGGGGTEPSTNAKHLVLGIIYEDKDVVVINKPPGMLVHPAAGSHEATVADWFAARYGSPAEGEGGYVHRLDRDTSGVLILARTPEAYRLLREQFKKHHAKKEYLALVFGAPGGTDGRITRPLIRSRRNPSRRTAVPPSESDSLLGKPAITEWRIEKKFGERFALLRVFPLTGRTHQIRVHLHYIGHPIVGDSLYTFKRQKPPAGVARQLLHAETLTVQTSPGVRKTFTAPLPKDFQSVLDRLEK
jgi:23S rRNA pseudouridine1911/1915/1917 synthase